MMVDQHTLTLPSSLMKSLQLGQVTSVYSFLFTSISPISTKIGTTADQQTLILSGRYDDVLTTGP